jgi:hypothetical protein
MSEILWKAELNEEMLKDVNALSFLFEELDNAIMEICQSYGMK